MSRALIFNCKVRDGGFYFVPSILYTWGECGCWSLNLVFGNLSIGAFTTCDPDWMQKL